MLNQLLDVGGTSATVCSSSYFTFRRNVHFWDDQRCTFHIVKVIFPGEKVRAGIVQYLDLIRIMYTAGQEGHQLKVMSFIHHDRLTPIPAVAFTVKTLQNTILTLRNAVWHFQAFKACIMALQSNIRGLMNLFSFTIWMFYALVFVCHIWLRFKKPDFPRPFKVKT